MAFESPEVTVLMPGHNARTTVVSAVRSVLAQTFTHFELLVVDDFSTDGTWEVLQGFSDPRIRCVRNLGNQGVARTLNRGIEESRGEFIARMDADDVCHTRRLQVQVEAMRGNPRLGALGAWIRLFGQYRQVVRQPWGRDRVRASLGFDNPICHPSVMLRRPLLLRTGLRYDPTFSRSEDFELWTRLSRHADLDNVPKVLLDYRVHAGSVTGTNLGSMRQQTFLILRRVQEEQGYERFDDEQEAFHYRVAHGSTGFGKEELVQAERWLRHLCSMNQVRKGQPPTAFEWVAGRAWFKLCWNNARQGVRAWLLWRASPLRGFGYVPSVREAAFFASSAVWWQCRGRRQPSTGPVLS